MRPWVSRVDSRSCGARHVAAGRLCREALWEKMAGNGGTRTSNSCFRDKRVSTTLIPNRMAESLGIGPRIGGSKPLVLPLHYDSIKWPPAMVTIHARHALTVRRLRQLPHWG